MFRCVVTVMAGVMAWPMANAWGEGSSADLLVNISRHLGTAAVLRGTFEQTKTLSGFKRPVVSRGSFITARELGVRWRTEEPFASTLTITRDSMRTSFDAAGQDSEVRQDPGMRVVNDMLIALLAGDVSSLLSRFRVEDGFEDGQGWRLTLQPDNAAVARLFTRIELSGDRYVNQVRLLEASGDESTIRFARQNSAALTPAEAMLFK